MNQINTSEKPKIGILGGTFDPIHKGHLMLAEYAFRQFDLDEVRFIPAGNPPHKQERRDGATARQRLEMVRLAVGEDPRFPVDPMEIDREGPSYTKDTLLSLRAQEPGSAFYFIIGADSMISLETWREPETICKNCTLIVAARSETDQKKLNQSMKKAKTVYGTDIRLLDFPGFAVSSSTVRSYCRESRSIQEFVPEAVVDYIDTNGLYRS